MEKVFPTILMALDSIAAVPYICKGEGRTSDIEKELKAFHDTKSTVPNELAYLESDYFADYINDM